MVCYDWSYSFLDKDPNLSAQKAKGLLCAHSKGLNKEADTIFKNLNAVYDELSSL
jgi:hypothetical protein